MQFIFDYFFNVIFFLLMSYSGLSLSIFFQTFKTVFLIIILIIVLRYFFLKYIFKFINLENLFEQVVFKSISSYFKISLLTFPLLLLYIYTFSKNITFLFFFSFLIVSAIFFKHLIIYFKISDNKVSSFFYIILYLCAFKITPWLLVYGYITI